MDKLKSALNKIRKAYAIINSKDYLDYSNEALIHLSQAMTEIETHQKQHKKE